MTPKKQLESPLRRSSQKPFKSYRRHSGRQKIPCRSWEAFPSMSSSGPPPQNPSWNHPQHHHLPPQPLHFFSPHRHVSWDERDHPGHGRIARAHCQLTSRVHPGPLGLFAIYHFRNLLRFSRPRDLAHRSLLRNRIPSQNVRANRDSPNRPVANLDRYFSSRDPTNIHQPPPPHRSI